MRLCTTQKIQKKKNGSGITEFGITEVTQQVDEADAEYIISTEEKKLGRQEFELAEEKKDSQAIAITKQPEQAYFPTGYIQGERSVLFTEKTDGVVENKVTVKEFNQPPVYSVPDKIYTDNSIIVQNKQPNEVSSPQTS